MKVLRQEVQLRMSVRIAAFYNRKNQKKLKMLFIDLDWVLAMQEELNQFERNKVWKLVPRPKRKNCYRNKMGIQKQDG